MGTLTLTIGELTEALGLDEKTTRMLIASVRVPISLSESNPTEEVTLTSGIVTQLAPLLQHTALAEKVGPLLKEATPDSPPILIDDVVYNPLPMAGPRNWERAVGYPGEARFVGFSWECFDDGQVAHQGAGVAWHHQREVFDVLPLPHEQRFWLGADDSMATHILLLDRDTRGLYFMPNKHARALLSQQHPPREETEIEQALREGHISIDEFLQSLREQVIAQQEERARFLKGKTPCSCWSGWVRADDGGYDLCNACSGHGWRDAPGGNNTPGHM